MTGTATVRCGACGYNSEVNTFAVELAAAQREIDEVKADYLEMRQQRDDLQARVEKAEGEVGRYAEIEAKALRTVLNLPPADNISLVFTT